MKIKHLTLNELSSDFSIRFSFPEKERKLLVEKLESIDDSIIREQIINSKSSILEDNINEKLHELGYYYSKLEPEKCQLWLPDYKMESDFYNPEKKISIEVEKTERKRVVHDVLKLINGSMTFVPRVKYGVLIIPNKYSRSSGKKSSFGTTSLREIPFYFQKIIPNNCNLNDILILIYN